MLANLEQQNFIQCVLSSTFENKPFLQGHKGIIVLKNIILYKDISFGLFYKHLLKVFFTYHMFKHQMPDVVS